MNDAVYRYGCQCRPAMFATAPSGFIAVAQNEDFRFGEVHYSRALTPEEIERYELIDLNVIRPAIGSVWSHPDGARFQIVSVNAYGVRMNDTDWDMEVGVTWKQFEQLSAVV